MHVNNQLKHRILYFIYCLACQRSVQLLVAEESKKCAAVGCRRVKEVCSCWLQKSQRSVQLLVAEESKKCAAVGCRRVKEVCSCWLQKSQRSVQLLVAEESKKCAAVGCRSGYTPKIKKREHEETAQTLDADSSEIAGTPDGDIRKSTLLLSVYSYDCKKKK